MNEAFAIWCPNCRCERQAVKRYGRARFVGFKRGRACWVNVCNVCGHAFPALPPRAVDVRRLARSQERAGQLAIGFLALGEKPRRSA